MNEGAKAAYVTGVIDGFFALSTNKTGGVSKEYTKSHWLYRCIKKGLLNNQVKAIVDKYLKENPEIWHRPMNNIVFTAMATTCPSYQEDLMKPR